MHSSFKTILLIFVILLILGIAGGQDREAQRQEAAHVARSSR